MDPRDLVPLIASRTITPLQLLNLLTFCELARPLRTPFHLDQFSENAIFEKFRFHRDNLLTLAEELKLPEVFTTDNGSVFSGLEGLCILLRRFAYPNRLVDIQHMFGRHKGELSKAVNWVLDHIYTNFGFLLTSLDLCWLTRADMELFAQASSRKGSILPNVWGFIDGTFRPCCRPGENQRVLYSGHYRLHGIKFQCIMTPNGLMVYIDGPWVGRRHDAGMLRESGLLDMLRAKMEEMGKTFLLYGDPAYPISDFIEAPFREGAVPLSEIEANFNERMSGVRICVEWGFGEIIQQFAFLDFSKNLKMGLQPVGKYYAVAALLTNCRTCFGYGGKTADFFGLAPPSVQSYLRNQIVPPQNL